MIVMIGAAATTVAAGTVVLMATKAITATATRVAVAVTLAASTVTPASTAAVVITAVEADYTAAAVASTVEAASMVAGAANRLPLPLGFPANKRRPTSGRLLHFPVPRSLFRVTPFTDFRCFLFHPPVVEAPRKENLHDRQNQIRLPGSLQQRPQHGWSLQNAPGSPKTPTPDRILQAPQTLIPNPPFWHRLGHPSAWPPSPCILASLNPVPLSPHTGTTANSLFAALPFVLSKQTGKRQRVSWRWCLCEGR